jgi:hypothetical protein
MVCMACAWLAKGFPETPCSREIENDFGVAPNGDFEFANAVRVGKEASRTMEVEII